MSAPPVPLDGSIIDLEVGYSRVKREGIDPFIEFIEAGEREFFKAKDFVTLYDLLFKMCIQRDPYNWSEAMYDKYTSSIQDYLVTKVAPALNRAQQQYDTAFLKEWTKRWNNHTLIVKGLSKLFMYLDRFYTPNTDHVPPLKEQGFKLYKETIFDHHHKYATQAILNAIEKERNNEQQDRHLLQEAVNVYVDLGHNWQNKKLQVYVQDLEKPLIAHAGEHYKRKSREWMDQDSAPVYMEKVEKVLAAEKNRVDAYLNRCTLEPLHKECYAQMLKTHQKELLRKKTGIFHLLSIHAVDDLSRMYRLYKGNEVDLEVIAEMLGEHIKKAGTEVVDKARPQAGGGNKEDGEDEGGGNRAEVKEKEAADEKKQSSGPDGSLSASSAVSSADANHALVRNLIALHAQYNEIVTNCFPEGDTRVLTDAGFLFLTQIEERLAAGEPVFYACYDSHSKRMVYSAGKVVISSPPERWVEFTESDTSHIWHSGTSDDYGATIPSKVDQANYMTLRTTPEHDMYVQLGHGSSPQNQFLPAHKIAAVELAPQLASKHCYSVCRIPTAPEHGVAPLDTLSIPDTAANSPVVALDLRTEEELNAFLLLYGYWLASGTLSYPSRAVSIKPKNSDDRAFVVELMTKLRLTSSEWQQYDNLLESRSEVQITKPCWFAYFNAEYHSEYLMGHTTDEQTEEEERINSQKWFWSWVLRRLTQQQLLLVMDGLRRGEHLDGQISTFSLRFRDELVVACLHAGYSAYFTINARAGLNGHKFDKWIVKYTQQTGELIRSTEVRYNSGESDIHEEYNPTRDGRAWCVQVSHPDHLIFAQRAHLHPTHHIVSKASRPMIVGNCFEKAQVMQKALKKAFEEFINKDNRVSKLLAKFVNDVLKKGSKVNVKDIESTLDNVVFLYGYIQEKDVFERDYQLFLSHRLLMGLCESEHSEKSMIAKLKTECGYQWTNKLEGMFKDVQLSKEMMQQFRKANESSAFVNSSNGTNSNIKPSSASPKDKSSSSSSSSAMEDDVQLEVNVCTTGYWPSTKVIPCKMPKDLVLACEKYKRFYLNQHSGHKLEWRFDQGQAELVVDFAANCRKGLVLSTYQMMILLIFNTVKRVTYKEIIDMTGIPRYEIANHLLSLCHPKINVMLKRPNNKKLEDNHQFMLNAGYKNQLKKVNIPLLRTVENEENGEEENKAIELQRRHQMDAAIVRIMKTRKTLRHNLLVAEVISQLSARFKPKPNDIKKRIEALIEQEYMERDANERGTYNYLA